MSESGVVHSVRRSNCCIVSDHVNADFSNMTHTELVKYVVESLSKINKRFDENEDDVKTEFKAVRKDLAASNDIDIPVRHYFYLAF